LAWVRDVPGPRIGADLALPRQGRETAARFLTEVVFRLVPEARFVTTHANRQPAVGVYTRDNADGVWRASGLLVITLDGDRIAGLTRFESATLRPFGLPRILADDALK
jgi:hypothetical protein